MAMGIPSGYKYIHPSWHNKGLRVYNGGVRGEAQIENLVTLHYAPNTQCLPMFGFVNGSSTIVAVNGANENYVFYPYQAPSGTTFGAQIDIRGASYNVIGSDNHGKFYVTLDNSPYNSNSVNARYKAFAWFLIAVYNGTLTFGSKPIIFKLKARGPNGMASNLLASQEAVIRLLQDGTNLKIYTVKSKLDADVRLETPQSQYYKDIINNLQQIDMAGLNVNMGYGVYFAVLSFGMEFWPYDRFTQ